MAKESNKKQGNKVGGASISSTNIMPEPRTWSRGIGTSFAMAVNRIMDAAASMAGSKNAFLGIEKKDVDYRENLHSSLLPKDFEAKNKLNEK